ncbi:hypothetical protein [Ruminococcus sp.]|uniref:hypothetical protein n=1 Tax=Ruminococcus sp. TaxID=41978 RepID=UPI0025DB150A|nr:hypothetical protein [Ruminococcus sp.]MBQ6251757.1 hypothetical protein [Ruminococcus sp.]
MLTLGAYLNLEELPDLLQSYLINESGVIHFGGDYDIYCIDHLGAIDADDNFQFYITGEEEGSIQTDIIPIYFNDFESGVDFLDIINALIDLRHLIKLKVVKSFSNAIETESIQYETY